MFRFGRYMLKHLASVNLQLIYISMEHEINHMYILQQMGDATHFYARTRAKWSNGRRRAC